jgi:hypothetical protein
MAIAQILVPHRQLGQCYTHLTSNRGITSVPQKKDFALQWVVVQCNIFSLASFAASTTMQAPTKHVKALTTSKS